MDEDGLRRLAAREAVILPPEKEGSPSPAQRGTDCGGHGCGDADCGDCAGLDTSHRRLPIPAGRAFVAWLDGLSEDGARVAVVTAVERADGWVYPRQTPDGYPWGWRTRDGVNGRAGSRGAASRALADALGVKWSPRAEPEPIVGALGWTVKGDLQLLHVRAASGWLRVGSAVWPDPPLQGVAGTLDRIPEMGEHWLAQVGIFPGPVKTIAYPGGSPRAQMEAAFRALTADIDWRAR